MEEQQQQNTYQPIRQDEPPYGNNIVLCTLKNKPFLVLGPHYYIFIIAFILINFTVIIFLLKTYSYLLPFWKVAVLTGIVIEMAAYLTIGFSNPGILPRTGDPVIIEYQGYRPDYCRYCRIYRPPGTRHCTDCDACILGHDHHCVWIGKCAGRNNIAIFYAFVTSVFIMFVIFIFAVLSANKNRVYSVG